MTLHLTLTKRLKMGIKEQLGSRIRELRLKNNLKQSELAEMVNIATKHQSCIETGKNYPSADLIEKYAKVFQLEPAEILNISHKKDIKLITLELDEIIKNSDESRLRLIYRIVKSIIQ